MSNTVYRIFKPTSHRSRFHALALYHTVCQECGRPLRRVRRGGTVCNPCSRRAAAYQNGLPF